MKRSAGSLVSLFALVVLAAGCGDDPAEPQEEADLVIRYIQRLPTLNWVANSADPTREGWPEAGQEVTWVAHVLNRHPEARDAVSYRWLVDDAEAAVGVVDLPAGGEATVELPWTWTFDRHRIAFEIDPADEVEDLEENNRLEVFSDGLSVGFWIERSIYEHFAQLEPLRAMGMTSFEDWAHRQIGYYNQLFGDAGFSETPQGVLDRLRLDKVTVVEDGSLPLVDIGYTGFDSTQSVPDAADSTVDLMWGFPSSLTYVYEEDRNTLDYSGYLQHEMGHARYLIDVYGLDVFQHIESDSVAILEGDVPVAGSKWMRGDPIVHNGIEGLRLYEAPNGLMGTDWDYLDRHSAAALNLIAGHRATAGSWNEPDNIGVYVNDLPAENRLEVRDGTGAPLPGALVHVYRSEPDPAIADLAGIYKSYFDDTPDMVLTADPQGRVLLGHNPFGDQVIHTMDFVNGTIILRVEHNGRVGYGFFDVTAPNLAYWRGETELADHVLEFEMIAP